MHSHYSYGSSRIQVLFLSLFYIATATNPHEFLKGFLSGFQDTEVILGEDCLSYSWMVETQTTVAEMKNFLESNDYISALGSIENLLLLFRDESNSCHLPDLANIITSIIDTPLSTKLYRMIAWAPNIILELKQALTDNSYTFGYHLGRALAYLENDDGKIPSIDTAVFGEIFEGFAQALVTKSDACTKVIQIMNGQIKQLFDSVQAFIQGQSVSENVFVMEVTLIFSSWLRMNKDCNAFSLPGEFFNAFFTKEGLVQTYIKYGMHINEIEALKSQMIKAFFSKNFVELGDKFGQIVSILIK
ncbi:hypothetical protein SteCoe_4207 [Stentor coeruleus]|uniref:Uncharacterized protein n=1 Tax=Stentor coeruleus TaxID=5963 RepID=A0A1R2CV38_9CILI|nr:hypothetical protein SteCoe_4207 [Stentor coeruleus]